MWFAQIIMKSSDDISMLLNCNKIWIPKRGNKLIWIRVSSLLFLAWLFCFGFLWKENRLQLFLQVSSKFLQRFLLHTTLITLNTTNTRSTLQLINLGLSSFHLQRRNLVSNKQKIYFWGNVLRILKKNSTFMREFKYLTRFFEISME